MLNKKPRIPAPVQIPDAFSYLQGFRDYLIAQTVSPHTRNAYLSDLVQCAECLSKPLPEWNHDDISDVLIALTKQQKSPRSIARCLSALRSFYKFLREQKLRSDNPVAALGTVYAMSAVDEDAMSEGLAALISGGGDLGWSVATGLSLLVWFIYAPHCLATLATVKRETGSWKTVSIMTVYLFGLAYFMSFLTYQIASYYLG